MFTSNQGSLRFLFFKLAVFTRGFAYTRKTHKRYRSKLPVTLMSTLLIAGYGCEAAFSAAGDTTLVSRGELSGITAPTGLAPSGLRSETLLSSSDGDTIAFEHSANLAGYGQQSFYTKVYVHEFSSGKTILASKTASGIEGNGDNSLMAYSANGRYVFFQTQSRRGPRIIYRYDIESGTSIDIGRTAAGLRFSVNDLAVSSDGRIMAFESQSPSLRPTDADNDSSHIFVKNIETNRISQLSLNAANRSANGNSYFPRMSGNGRIVTFESTATDLVENDDSDQRELFVFDRDTSQIRSLGDSLAPDYSQPRVVQINQDGRYVLLQPAFEQIALVLDTQSGGFEVASVDLTGAVTEARNASLSADGRRVVFHVSHFRQDNNNSYLRDLNSDLTSLVTRRDDGVVNSGNVRNTRISADGSYAFSIIEESNWIDYSRSPHLYRHRLDSGEVSIADVYSPEYAIPANIPGDRASFNPQTSQDGRYVSFTSKASNLINNDVNRPNPDNIYETQGHDIFVYDHSTQAIELISVNSDGVQGNADSFYADISSDGRFVAFTSEATNLSDDYSGGQDDRRASVYVRDRQTAVTKLVAEAIVNSKIGFRLFPEDPIQNRPVISGNGRYVVFSQTVTRTRATYLKMYDTQTGLTTIISDSVRNVEPESFRAFAASIDDQGTSIAFAAGSFSRSKNQNLLNDGAIYRYDIASARASKVSEQVLQWVESTAISGDGKTIAYAAATDIIDYDSSGIPPFNGVYVFDSNSGETTRLDGNDAETPRLLSLRPSLSADGRFVVFASARKLLDNDRNEADADIYLRDLRGTTNQLISVSSSREQGNASSYTPSLSADGQVLAYASASNNLNPDDPFAGIDVFRHEIVGATTLPALSVTPDSVAESDGRTYLTLSLSSAPVTPVSLKVSTLKQTAEPGKDFYGLYREIRFAPGETKKRLALEVLDDDIREADETLGLRVWDLQNAIGADIPQAIVIEDND